MTVRTLFIVTALFEATTGLALVIAPSALAAVLLGAPLDAPAAMAVGRVAGAALIALGVACWLARDDAASRAARGLVGAMLLYNVAVPVLVIQARLGSGLSGVAFWPVLLVHGAAAVWCFGCLAPRRASSPRELPPR